MAASYQPMEQTMTSTRNDEPIRQTQAPAKLTGFAATAGKILAVSYPVLALSTGFRAFYQLLLKEDVTNLVGPSLSAVAATCYLLATIGFAVQKRWAWWLSVLVLGFETLMTLIVGTWSIVDPDAIGGTVWRLYGADYGFFPLLQPIIGLVWLFHPVTRGAYFGLRAAE
jgi:hypothetical protein